MLLSFVPIITQWPASGGSALIGYAGRFTARTVSKETKESSAIITASTQIAALGGASISLPCTTAIAGRSSHDAVIRVYDETGSVIETHEHKGDFKEW